MQTIISLQGKLVTGGLPLPTSREPMKPSCVWEARCHDGILHNGLHQDDHITDKIMLCPFHDKGEG